MALLSWLFVIPASALEPGDVLLQSQPCFMCSLIELEEGLPYSHAGIAIREVDGSWSVLEAWNQVERVPLLVFLARRRAGTRTLVLRPALLLQGQALNDWLDRRFASSFAGHHYDSEFLWNNADQAGEKYYCSELIAKLLSPVLVSPLPTKPMHFIRYRQYWIKYFGGTPPDGTPGISPADLARRPQQLRAVGFLN